MEFGEVNDEPVVWPIETLPEPGVAVVLGIVLAVVLLHLANLFGYVAGRMSLALLQWEGDHDRPSGEPQTGINV